MKRTKEMGCFIFFNAMSGCGIVKFTRKGGSKDGLRESKVCYALTAFFVLFLVFVLICAFVFQALLHCIPGPSEERTFISSECRRGISHMNLGELL